MDPEIFPLLTSDDYEAFRRILGAHLPDAYDKWLQLHTHDVTEHRRVGRAVREVKVDPHEFADFLHARGHVANLKTLREFTFEKAFRDPNT